MEFSLYFLFVEFMIHSSILVLESINLFFIRILIYFFLLFLFLDLFIQHHSVTIEGSSRHPPSGHLTLIVLWHNLHVLMEVNIHKRAVDLVPSLIEDVRRIFNNGLDRVMEDVRADSTFLIHIFDYRVEFFFELLLDDVFACMDVLHPVIIVVGVVFFPPSPNSTHIELLLQHNYCQKEQCPYDGEVH